MCYPAGEGSGLGAEWLAGWLPPWAGLAWPRGWLAEAINRQWGCDKLRGTLDALLTGGLRLATSSSARVY